MVILFLILLKTIFLLNNIILNKKYFIEHLPIMIVIGKKLIILMGINIILMEFI